MNNHLKQTLYGVLILIWMIVYWILVGLLPKVFQDFYEEYHNELFHSTIAISLLLFLVLVFLYRKKTHRHSFVFITLLAAPYVLFLSILVFVAENLPRISDLFFLVIGVFVIFIIENNSIRQKMIVFILSVLLIIPSYYFVYDNVLNYVIKGKLIENRKLAEFNFEITDRFGNSCLMEDFKGSTVCVDMWASSCGNCIASMPDFEKLSSNFKKNKDYKIISLYCPISKEQTYEWFKEYIGRKFDYDIDYYYIDYESFKKLGIRQFPEFLIINKKTNLVYRGQISYLPYVNDNIYNKLKNINENY